MEKPLCKYTCGMRSSGLWKINAVTSTDPFKFDSMNLKKCLLSLKMQVCKRRRWISLINSLNSTDLLLALFNIVIVPDALNPLEISESAAHAKYLLLRIPQECN